MTNKAEQAYKSGRALEMAVKEKARQSGQDTNRAINDFYVGRLLERVFSQDEPQFVLKGGRSVLGGAPVILEKSSQGGSGVVPQKLC